MERVAVLSGPNHAEEVARDFPTASVVAAADIELARTLQAAISAGCCGCTHRVTWSGWSCAAPPRT